jgi:hypothetical protein
MEINKEMENKIFHLFIKFYEVIFSISNCEFTINHNCELKTFIFQTLNPFKLYSTIKSSVALIVRASTNQTICCAFVFVV